MGKKIDRGEPKKECPSCGLGVSLEANMCEFCGWDFEEEDEWILQIEKLERELMLEKRKFEPGTVDHKIETTLRDIVSEKAKASEAAGPDLDEPEQRERPVAQTAEDLITPEAVQPVEPRAQSRPTPVPEPSEGPRIRKTRRVVAATRRPEPVTSSTSGQPTSEALRTRKVRLLGQRPPEPSPGQAPVKKVRTVRKVKQ